MGIPSAKKGEGIWGLEANFEEEGRKSEEKESDGVGEKRDGERVKDQRDEEEDDGSLAVDGGRNRNRSRGSHWWTETWNEEKSETMKRVYAGRDETGNPMIPNLSSHVM